jgi:hypothetical protein
LASRVQVNQTPFVAAAHGICVAAAQEAHVRSLLFQIVEALREPIQPTDVQFDRTLKLLAAIHEQSLLVALVLEGDARDGEIEQDGDGASEGEDQQQREAALRGMD